LGRKKIETRLDRGGVERKKEQREKVGRTKCPRLKKKRKGLYRGVENGGGGKKTALLRMGTRRK